MYTRSWGSPVLARANDFASMTTKIDLVSALSAECPRTQSARPLTISSSPLMVVFSVLLPMTLLVDIDVYIYIFLSQSDQRYLTPD